MFSNVKEAVAKLRHLLAYQRARLLHHILYRVGSRAATYVAQETYYEQ